MSGVGPKEEGDATGRRGAATTKEYSYLSDFYHVMQSAELEHQAVRMRRELRCVHGSNIAWLSLGHLKPARRLSGLFQLFSPTEKQPTAAQCPTAVVNHQGPRRAVELPGFLLFSSFFILFYFLRLLAFLPPVVQQCSTGHLQRRSIVDWASHALQKFSGLDIFQLLAWAGQHHGGVCSFLLPDSTNPLALSNCDPSMWIGPIRAQCFMSLFLSTAIFRRPICSENLKRRAGQRSPLARQGRHVLRSSLRLGSHRGEEGR